MRGSHEIWTHRDGGTISLPAGGKPNRDVSAGVLAKIRRQTGLEELR
jgi:predicted RNA binding protein YcfA (HicA-like mRNA interferase family)